MFKKCGRGQPNTLNFENRVVYEITWKITEQPDSLQIKIWRMRIAYQKAKATSTHSEYVIRIVFALQHWFTNGSQYYVILTSAVSFKINT
jgi:hypothetical protein